MGKERISTYITRTTMPYRILDVSTIGYIIYTYKALMSKLYAISLLAASALYVPIQYFHAQESFRMTAEVLFFMACSIAVDTMSGILRAVHPKNNKGRWAVEKFQAGKLLLSLVKYGSYVALFFMLRWVGIMLDGGMDFDKAEKIVVFIVGVGFGIYEILSAAANFGQIYPSVSWLRALAKQHVHNPIIQQVLDSEVKPDDES